MIDGTKPGRVSYLCADEEQELETYLTQANEVGYGKTRRDVKAIAEKVAAEKGVLRSSHISDGWWKRFLQRHPKLRLRSGDATGHVRMDAMNKDNLKNYFNLLKHVIEENGLQNHPECVYNMDESGLPLDPKPPKVIAVKGQRKVRYRNAGSKSQITVLGCCSATGQALPPFIIFQGKQLNYQWTRGEIPGTRYGVSESGWTDRDLFRGWLMEHFLTHAVAGRPLLLLVDGHSSHYDPDTIRFAKEHNVIIFCLPPHTTHEAQPLDISFFGPLKTNWREVCHKFLQSNPGKAVTKYNFVELFAKAWLKTCSPGTICSGFRRAGIVPFCPDVLLERCPGSDNSIDMDQDVSESSTSEPSNIEVDDTEASNVVSESTHSSFAFSPEKEELYCRRFEEGYDLFDEEYERWLYINHPEAVLESSVIDHFAEIDPIPPIGTLDTTPNGAQQASSEATPPSEVSPNGAHQIASKATPPSKSLPLAVNKGSFNSSPVPSVPETPPTNSVIQRTPTRVHSPLSDIGNCSGRCLSESSLLGKHLTPVPVQKPSKTGQARVLTSAECIELLEEKRRKKEQEAEEKEARKKERERKKAEREELQRKKKELQQQRKEAALKKKSEAAARKLAAAARKKTGKTRSSARGRKVMPPQKPSSESTVNSLVSSASCGQPSTSPGLSTASPEPYSASPESSSASPGPSSASPGQSSAVQNSIWQAEELSLEEVCECAFCFRSYQEDGAEWVECGCGRWVHDLCMEEVVLDRNGVERFCPFCLNQ